MTTDAQVLALPMRQPNGGPGTVRSYLLTLLETVWREGEMFNGKRPFGNSGWQYDLYLPLIQARLVAGKLDEDGYIDSVDDRTADAMIASAIQSLGETS